MHHTLLLKAATSLPYRQLKGIQAGKWGGQGVNLPSNPAQSHFCMATRMQLLHQKMSHRHLPKDVLYTIKGNCNLTKKIILSKVIWKMIRGGSTRCWYSLESTGSLISWPSQHLARFAALVLIPMPSQCSPTSCRLKFLKQCNSVDGQDNFSKLRSTFFFP